MKIKLFLASALVAFALPTSAATFTVSNVVSGTGATDALYQNSDGTLLAGGIVHVGYFPAGYSISSSLNDIEATITNFTSFASQLAGTFSADLGGAFPGYVQGPGVAGPTITGADPLVGRALYAFVGNGATLAASNAFGLKQVDTLRDDVPFNNEYLANPFGGVAPVIGSVGNFVGNASGLGSSPYTTLQLALIPEPSTALLGLIGTLGLLRRRRI